MTEAELAFLARNGYLQLPGLVAPADCEQMVAETWRQLPAAWQPDSPGEWRGPVQDSCHAAPVHERGGHLKFQRGSYTQLPAIERAFGPASRCAEAVRAMLGPRVAPARQRGLYVVVPTRAGWRPRPPVHHIESHPVHVIALAYLRDVAPGAGGLLVWPGSHRELYPLMGSKLDYVATPEFDAAYARWSGLRPLELPGRQGDVIFIHHRLLHAPSINGSREMRFGFLCDYVREDQGELARQRPGPDAWEDWEGVARLDAEERTRSPDARLRRRFGLPERWRMRWPTRPPAAAQDHANKADASTLARERRPGDVWLVVSDTQKGWGSPKLDPRGGDLVGRGLSVEVDGKVLAPAARNAFVARIGEGNGTWRIRIRNAPCPVWVKVVSLRLPLSESAFVLAEQLGPGTHELEARLEGAAATPGP